MIPFTLLAIGQICGGAGLISLSRAVKMLARIQQEHLQDHRAAKR